MRPSPTTCVRSNPTSLYPLTVNEIVRTPLVGTPAATEKHTPWMETVYRLYLLYRPLGVSSIVITLSECAELNSDLPQSCSKLSVSALSIMFASRPCHCRIDHYYFTNLQALNLKGINYVPKANLSYYRCPGISYLQYEILTIGWD